MGLSGLTIGVEGALLCSVRGHKRKEKKDDEEDRYRHTGAELVVLRRIKIAQRSGHCGVKKLFPLDQIEVTILSRGDSNSKPSIYILNLVEARLRTTFINSYCTTFCPFLHASTHGTLVLPGP